MSEEKQYSDQWDNLPLPDGDVAWQKMELLLGKEEKRRIVPVWFWRYAGLSLFVIGLAVGGWLLLQSSKSNPGKTSSSGIETARPGSKKQETNITTTPEEKHNNVVDEKEKTNEQTITSSPTADAIVTDKTVPTTSSTVKRRASSVVEKSETQQKTSGQHNHRKPSTTIIFKSQPSLQKQKLEATIVKEDSVATKESLTVSDTPNSAEEKDVITEKKENIVKKDSATKPEEPNNIKEEKKDSAKKKAAFIVSAGAGFQQAIAINGQQAVSVNYKGKKGTLSDRIPSVYIQLQKGKWFAQAEFQYASPQPVQPFSFNQKTRYDVASVSVNTERFTIQKLYYHQLPFSVNYQPFPNWSVGAGAIYNILAGAVTEQEVQSKNLQTGAESFQQTLSPVNGYKDSFLYKTTAGILIQTDYHWKRFSLGLRYTQNVQPFMKYTRPDGQVLDEKNKVFQAILRIRLWSNQ